MDGTVHTRRIGGQVRKEHVQDVISVEKEQQYHLRATCSGSSNGIGEMCNNTWRG